MVDSPEYARSMVRKIEAYENNGIFSGERITLIKIPFSEKKLLPSLPLPAL